MESKLVLREVNNVKFYQSTSISSNNRVRHFFSTRVGGYSEGDYKSLNLGIYTNDSRLSVDRNFKRVIESAGMTTESLVYLKQVHGNNFYFVDGINYSEIKEKEGDALITKTKGIAIGVFTADCVPIILVDNENDIIAVVHAGWRGTELHILSRVLEYMINILGAGSKNIVASIGPFIGSCCFEVNLEVADKFKHKVKRENKWYVDLWQENYDELIKCGISEENIDNGKLCTMCNSELFFSYRRDNGKTGRLGTFVQLI
jgi:polyphenol oxidase